MKTDELDDLILSALRKDARTPNVEIAKTAGLTEGAVRSRIKRMVKDGIITRFTVETTGSGATYFGIVMLKAKKETKAMMSEIASSAIAKDAYEISGEYDSCVILEGTSVEDIDRKIDALRKLRNVADTRTYISFKRW
jgi:DNA-binding Lrp family transcriptional regulator